jgi:hypothetical protein
MLMRLLWTSCLLAVATLAHGNGALGTVFLDSNGNGLRDAGEAGVAGAMVSNGTDIAITDASGRWQLPLRPGQTLFVIKPAGYSLPRDARGLPRFWRHHLPQGSPPLAYGGIAPTGDLPDSVDFALLPGADEERYSVAVVADPQPNDAADVDHFRRGTMPGLQREPGLALGLLLGDVANDDLALYPALIAALGEVDFPWFAVPGNHDIDLDAPDDATSTHTWRGHFGPDTYALQVGRVHFLMLNNVIAEFGAHGFSYIGGLREDQFRFISAWLPQVPRDHRIVVAGHIPMTARDGRETFRRADRERMYRLLAGRPVTVLAGHAHQQRIHWHGEAEGWLGEPLMEWTVGAASGSFWSGLPDAEGIPHAIMSDGTPRGFGLLDVDAIDLVPSWRAAGRPREEVMRVHAPRVLRHGSYPSALLLVNVYLGEEGTAVRFRVGEGDWQPMRHAPGPDPAVRAINVRQDEAVALFPGGRVPDAVPSTHLWRAALPTGLEPGQHRVEVEVTDRFGRVHRESTSYRLHP